MKIFTVFSLIFLISLPGYTQKQKLVFYGTNMQQMVSSAYYVPEEEEAKFRMMDYLYPAWHPGRLEFVNGSVKDSVYLNYNLIRGTVEELSKGKLRVYSMYRVRRFELFDSDLKGYVTYLGINALLEKWSNKVEFVRLVADGDAKLVERTYIQMPAASSSPSSYGGMYDGNPDKKREYYLYEHNVLKPLRKAKTFAGKRKEIKNFVKVHGLKWSNEADLIKIVSHYNTLNKPEISSKELQSIY